VSKCEEVIEGKRDSEGIKERDGEYDNDNTVDGPYINILNIKYLILVLANR